METTAQLLNRIDVLERQRDEFRHLAETDPLTDLSNRRGLERKIDTREGWFVVADLNNFKAAQDTHPDGHLYGDRILSEFAEFLQRSVRKHTDHVVSRLGGDEFVVWCPTYAGARRIWHVIANWYSVDLWVDASVGMGSSMEEADRSMFNQKKK